MIKILYAEGNTATIVEDLYKSLGKPSIEEITKETIRDKWLLAFARFNEKVGKLGYHTCNTVAKQQVYELSTLIPAEDIRDVLKVIRNCSTIKTTNIAEYYGMEEYVFVNDNSSDIDVINSIPAGHILDDYAFKYVEPNKLILYNKNNKLTIIINKY